MGISFKENRKFIGILFLVPSQSDFHTGQNKILIIDITGFYFWTKLISRYDYFSFSSISETSQCLKDRIICLVLKYHEWFVARIISHCSRCLYIITQIEKKTVKRKKLVSSVTARDLA